MIHPEIKIDSTAEAIEEMAEVMQRAASDMAYVATRMRATGDVEKVLDALNILRSLNANLRTDLLIARPMREYQKQLYEAQQKASKN